MIHAYAVVHLVHVSMNNYTLFPEGKILENIWLNGKAVHVGSLRGCPWLLAMGY